MTLKFAAKPLGPFMKLKNTIILTTLASSFTINCFAGEPNVQVKNFEAPGNLESKYALGCIGANKISNKYTPPDLYKAVLECSKLGKNNDGALLFAIAGAYGKFDTLRVSDKSAHQAISVLKMQMFASIPTVEQNAFKESVKKAIVSPEGLEAACKVIKRIGPPNYYPTYMIQHGMGAFTQSTLETKLEKGFDTNAAWKQALDSYLHCPNL